MSDVIVAGETLVDFLPEGTGRLDEVERFAPREGGSAANVAMALAHLGHPPLFFTNIATDPFGDALAATLDACGIPDDLVFRDDGATTTLALISATPDGEPTFTFYRDRGADTRLPVGAVGDDVLQDAAWIHFTGVTLTAEPSRTATMELLRRASIADCTVSLDPNVRETMWESPDTMTAVLRGAISLADVIISSAAELHAIDIAIADVVAQARRVCSFGPHTTMLTLGRDGAIVVGTESSPLPGTHHHEGFRVDTVDTTGAGDAFAAAVIATMRNGVTDPTEVLAAANATAAVSTVEQGAVNALRDPSTVEELLGAAPWRSRNGKGVELDD